MGKEGIVDNDQVLRCLKLGVAVNGLVIGGKRDSQQVASVLQVINDQPDFGQRLLKAKIVVDTSQLRQQLVEWHQFDRKFFPDYVRGNYDGLRLPEAPAGFGWTIVDEPGVTENIIVARMRREFKVSTYVDDLDANVESDREAISGPYVALVRDRIEADEELANQSAEALAEAQITCVTLRQRLRLGMFYWWKTGKHLDLKSVTLCAGSRFSGGHVPEVYWGDDKLRVFWYDLQGAFPDLRGRAAAY